MEVFLGIVLLVLFVLFTLNKSKIIGSIGEAYVRKQIMTLNPEVYKSVHDLYIPINSGRTSQIDHVIISEYGIFVIETKNYEGWIFGSENQKQWTQVIYKRKEKFSNPIWQNYGHIQALKEYLGMEITDLAFYNIVVFTKRAEFKFDPTSFTSAKIMHPKQITRFIHNEIGRKISQGDVNKILVKLSSIKDQDSKVKREIKKNHVKKIKESKNTQQVITKLGQCPKCGNALTSRKGKYGAFMGCSNYPKCRYTSAS
ncbi:hypothetical protein JOC85_003624 [Bacillus mesophilus]|uniref:NERD domain-containing protein n=1 Tax=Bacillus mesophilus TaxID=1808955 RepID=A0A6M0QAK8_9BACI|nr:NERD domain-containing protein [Bacillus mesophilus]MBM7662813.1 hypothetical protein [Bacillus mesophilus]NEY73404.1 NERD domain-containing protein [Bacillus mesophilus]